MGWFYKGGIFQSGDTFVPSERDIGSLVIRILLLRVASVAKHDI